jgi:hypothetical protein
LRDRARVSADGEITAQTRSAGWRSCGFVTSMRPIEPSARRSPTGMYGIGASLDRSVSCGSGMSVCPV